MANESASAAIPFPLGMVADDLTGACDAGAQFARIGCPARVWLDPTAAPDSASALTVLSAESRRESPEVAAARVAQACRFLHNGNVTVCYHKIDSTLRGNIGTEIAAILKTCGHLFAIVAPAFPRMGRRIEGGWLRAANPAEFPARHLPALLREQGLTELGALSLDAVRSPELAARMRRMQGTGARVLVADAATEDDLARIAQASLAFSPVPLLVGSAGLAAHLASCLAPEGGLREQAPSLASPGEGPVVLCIGSQSAVTAAQRDALIQETNARLFESGESRAALRDAIRAGANIVLPVGWRGEAETEWLRESLRMARETARIGGLILSGGDTAAHICRLLDAQGIRLRGEVVTGVPWGTLIGGAWAETQVCTKAGGFGGRQTLVEAVRFLREGHPPPQAGEAKTEA